MCESAKPTPASNLRGWFSGYRPAGHITHTAPKPYAAHAYKDKCSAWTRVSSTDTDNGPYLPAQYCLDGTPVARHDTQSPGIMMLGIMLTTSEAALCAKKFQAEGWQEAAT
ncbi:hypothetical protein FP744_10006382 [Trichoderma asperellum]